MISGHTNQVYTLPNVLLYQVVFKSRPVILMVLVLLTAFLLQPVEQAFANESDDVVEVIPKSIETAPPLSEPAEAETSPTNEANQASEDTNTETVEIPSEADNPPVVLETLNDNTETPTGEEADTAAQTLGNDDDESTTADPAELEPGDINDAGNAGSNPQTESITEEADTATQTPTVADEVAKSSTTQTVPETTSNNSGGTSSSSSSSDTKTTVGTTSSTTGNLASSTSTTTGEYFSSTTSATSTDSTTSEAPDDTNPTETDTPSTETATETDSPTPNPTNQNVDDTEPPAGDVLGVTTSSTTSTTSPIVYMEREAITDENRYQFGVHECVSVGDGSYYCSESEKNTGTLHENGVYAAPDVTGDYEIYYQVDGETRQITDNAYDDGAPYLDMQTEEVVWHRLVGSRYQIIHYDLATGEETQLTDTPGSSMEPAIANGQIVWQQWIDGNWDIMLFDGETTIPISASTYHDVAPAIRDGFVMWHTTGVEGEKLLSVYELATGVASTLSDPDGGHVENPRFVLVYDTVSDNGDTITKEYDFESGDIRPLSSEPAPLPPRIPDPEPTEETKALVNSKSTGREDTVKTSDDADTTSTPVGNEQATSSVSTTATTSPNVGAEITELNLASSTEPAEELTEFDLVVEPYASSSRTQSVDTASTTNDVE